MGEEHQAAVAERSSEDGGGPFSGEYIRGGANARKLHHSAEAGSASEGMAEPSRGNYNET